MRFKLVKDPWQMFYGVGLWRNERLVVAFIVACTCQSMFKTRGDDEVVLIGVMDDPQRDWVNIVFLCFMAAIPRFWK